MIPKEAMDELLRYEPTPGSKVLSVYLDVDQGRQTNLNRNFESQLKTVLREVESRDVDEVERSDFARHAATAVSFVEGFDPTGKTLVFFTDPAQDFQRSFTLPVPSPKSKVFWSSRPRVEPLVTLQDEYERYAIVLADREHARILIVNMHAVEDQADMEAEMSARQFDSTGKDQRLSQMRFQHRQDNYAHQHLKEVADKLSELAENHEFDRLILSGTEENTAELRKLLTPELEERYVGAINLRVDAPDHEVLQAASDFSRKVEREEEMGMINNVMEQAAANNRATTGIARVTEAVLKGAVDTLYYAENPSLPKLDWQVARSALQDASGAPEVTDDCYRSPDKTMEWLIETVLRQGGSVEEVRGAAADKLRNEAKGVAALLRF